MIIFETKFNLHYTLLGILPDFFRIIAFNATFIMFCVFAELIIYTLGYFQCLKTKADIHFMES